MEPVKHFKLELFTTEFKDLLSKTISAKKSALEVWEGPK